MKKRPSLIILVSALMLLNSGCGGSPSSSPSPSPGISPSPGSTTPPVSPSPSPQAGLPSAPTSSPADLTVLGLIPSTKANQRRQEILAGRTNPFALIPVEATIRQTVCVAPKPPTPGEVAMTAMRPQSSSGNRSSQPKGGSKNATAKTSSGTQADKADRTNQTVAEAPTGNLPSPSALFGNQTETPNLSGNAPANALKSPNMVISKSNKLVVALPKTNSAGVPSKLRGKPSAILAKGSSSPMTPEMIPTEANAVEVSGVMTIGSKPFAIVKAPGEPVARYVGVGSRLSNGAVRVSDINTDIGNPGITVEQYGVSVFRGVGQPFPGSVPVGETEKNKYPASPSLNYYRTISPKARSLYGGASRFLSLPTQFLAQLPSMDDRQVPTFEAVPKGPRSVAIVPPDTSGFGEVRSLSLLALKVEIGGSSDSTKSTGIICNTGKAPIKVGDLTLQLEDKTSNTILDSMVINFQKSYSLKYGQKLEFDGSIPDFRGRSLKNVTVKLVDWSSGKP